MTRTASPNGLVEAVVMETNGGVTDSFGYRVYVVPKGGKTTELKPVALVYGAVHNSNAYGVNLRWVRPDKLNIEYLKAKTQGNSLP